MAESYAISVYTRRANQLVKENIDAVLRKRNQTRKDLAFYCQKSESWISKIFRNPAKELPVKYWDRIADFLGLATYQLLQPGISPLTERRSGHERRSLQDRRIGPTARQMRVVAGEIDAHHPRRKGPLGVLTSTYAQALERLNAEHARKVSALLSQAESGRQTPMPRSAVAPSPDRRRRPRRPDAEKPDTGKS